MKNILIIAVLAIMAITVSFKSQVDFIQNGKNHIINEKGYQCPMKCEGEKIYIKPGKCPVCGMNLKEIKSDNLSGNSKKPEYNSAVKIVGAMKNVMMKGELFPTIDLDTISDKQHIYGLGPVEYLEGESMLLDGKSYKSVIVNNEAMKVTETFRVKAPFYGYANIQNWKEVEIPDSISTIVQLERFLDLTTKSKVRPYFFRMTAIADNATIHVVNLPKGTKVSSPEDAHLGQKNFNIKNASVELLGFFSTEHKAIFTHHNTSVHIHLITGDKQKMGHLDSLTIRKGSAKMYLPE